MAVAGCTLTLAAAAVLPAYAGDHGHGHANGHDKKSTAQHHKTTHPTTQSHKKQGSAPEAAPTATRTDSTNAGHNPPGNNGTVFIHDVAGDHSPHNVPHVSCTFYADFFGFDAGQVVTVSFAGHAPTGAGTALGGTWTGIISTDDAGGAGHDFDDELAFTADQLGVSALGAPAKQGYHVKMTVATGEPGGKKSKVFWIEPCAPVVGGTTGGTSGDTTGGAVLGDTTGGAVLGTTTGSATSSGQATGGATVLGLRFTRPAGAAVSGSATGLAALPFTGTEIKTMAAVAIAAISAGLMFVAAGRRRTAMPG
jgi:hypothetical protein